ncbi:CRIB domain-containing protein RIC10-like isoform X2 [Chenopodium quinoa]|uniref:CRIB domain-containing protein n=1 Tax=Chenopodium quinoa TaxID=63459 RepID=A0A803M214_CHEQI|nr:CRIB domain-containing protein RIC10-like isoform X2 [Chenopodium quinoa]
MTTKIKGMCKGSFKYISNIFVVKEREMEIGLPTDVKHVAHIGWDGPEGTTPSWMSEFGGGSDLAVGSMGGSVGGSREQTWTSQDFERSFGRQTSTTNKLSNFPPSNSNSKKVRRKKTKSSNSSPKSGSARSSRSSKSQSMLGESEEGESRRNSVYV